MSQPKIINRTTLHQGFLHIQKLTIQQDEQTYSYEFLEKKDASAVLVVDEHTQEAILVKQWRPINNGTITTECVAGLIDDGETPVSTAIKEVYEEIGYTITAENLRYFGAKLVSPGSMGERYHLYIAVVNDTMRTAIGGGLANEHENIEIVRMPIETCIAHYDQITDLKTAYLISLYKMHYK